MMSEECRNPSMTEVPITYFIVVICTNFRFTSTNSCRYYNELQTYLIIGSY